MERTTAEIWGEITRTAELIRMYQPMLDDLEARLLREGGWSGEDAAALSEVVSDAMILVGLLRELERRGVSFDRAGS